MENKYILRLVRKEFLNDRVIGELFLPDGKRFSYTLEDTDRMLNNKDSLTKIKKVKKAKLTAVPAGTYRIILSYSIKLKRYLPLLLDVKGFRGIRIHKGSSPLFSSGCILVGLSRDKIRLEDINEAEEKLISMLDEINKTKAIYITIERETNAL